MSPHGPAEAAGLRIAPADWSPRKQGPGVRARRLLQRMAVHVAERAGGIQPEAVRRTLLRAASALTDAGIPFAVGGGTARWARGGPDVTNDVDILVKPADALRAFEVLKRIGMRAGSVCPWGFEAWDGRVVVDLICSISEPAGPLVTDELIMSADEFEVEGVRMRVERLEDDFVSKLLAIGEAAPDYRKVLLAARCVREQVDWREVRVRTQHSPFAAAFFTMADALGITAPPVERDQPVRHLTEVRS